MFYFSPGENNKTCFVQKVFYQKWEVFEMVTVADSPISSFMELQLVSGKINTSTSTLVVVFLVYCFINIS